MSPLHVLFFDNLSSRGESRRLRRSQELCWLAGTRRFPATSPERLRSGCPPPQKYDSRIAGWRSRMCFPECDLNCRESSAYPRLQTRDKIKCVCDRIKNTPHIRSAPLSEAATEDTTSSKDAPNAPLTQPQPPDADRVQ